MLAKEKGLEGTVWLCHIWDGVWKALHWKDDVKSIKNETHVVFLLQQTLLWDPFTGKNDDLAATESESETETETDTEAEAEDKDEAKKEKEKKRG